MNKIGHILSYVVAVIICVLVASIVVGGLVLVAQTIWERVLS